MPRRDGREAERMSEAAHSAKTQYENSVRLVLAREGAERIVREPELLNESLWTKEVRQRTRRFSTQGGQ